MYAKNPTKEAVRKLVKANEHNSARAAIAEHCSEGLKEALQLEKKKRRQGKKLNLTGEASGCAQFFGTKEVLKAQALLDIKDQKLEQEKRDKEKAKEEKAITIVVKKALAEQKKVEKAKQKEINA